MKTAILDLTKKEMGKIELPLQFNEEVRADIIKKAVLYLLSHKKQAYGAKPRAGKRASAFLSKRRRDYRGTYGIGQSRTPRKVMSRQGRRLHYVGAVVPQTVGGRRAHPPKAGKVLWKKMNKKERKMAIRSAIAATVIKDIVKERGHNIPDVYPIILEEKFENLDKTKDVKKLFEKMDLKAELERVSVKKIRAGKGKARGRKYKTKRGPLIVVGKECKLLNAAKNIPAVEVVCVNELNSELLAPGGIPGRLTIWSKQAIDRLTKERLFF